MVDVEIAINELRDVTVAARFEDEIYEAVEQAGESGTGHVGISVLDEGRCVDIQVEVLGWTAHRTVPCEPRPGQVRAAVAELLESVGLM